MMHPVTNRQLGNRNIAGTELQQPSHSSDTIIPSLTRQISEGGARLMARISQFLASPSPADNSGQAENDEEQGLEMTDRNTESSGNPGAPDGLFNNTSPVRISNRTKNALMIASGVLAGLGPGVGIGRATTKTPTIIPEMPPSIHPDLSPTENPAKSNSANPTECPNGLGVPHLAPKYVHIYDVNLLGQAGLHNAKIALEEAGQLWEKFNQGNQMIDKQTYEAHFEDNQLIWVNFAGRPTMSKDDFFKEVMAVAIKDDFEGIEDTDILTTFESVWDNSDLADDTMVDEPAWNKAFSLQDWGSFGSVRESAMSYQAEQFWGSLPTIINETDWQSHGFDEAGYAPFKPFPSNDPTGEISKGGFLRNVAWYPERAPDLLPETVNKKELEYFAVNDSRLKSLMPDLGLTETGFDLINFRTDGRLFDKSFDDYASSNGYGDFIEWGELANAIHLHFAGPTSTT